MTREMFEPTVPFGEPELMRASGFRRYLDELAHDSEPGSLSSRISQLSPSLQADLLRFGQDGDGSELLEVLAACVRHAKRLTVHLECGGHVIPLTVFAHERLVHCPVHPRTLVERYLAQLRVMHVEPSVLRPPGDAVKELVGEPAMHHPLPPLMWEIAMKGGRAALLPEIEGPAAYRVAPVFDASGLPPLGALAPVVERLARGSVPLREIAEWPGMDRERATRLLNALYLQSALIVSRTHPGATRGDHWF